MLHEFREYERATTTVMNAYVQPACARYLTASASALQERELRAAVSVVRSDGGLMSIAAAAATPVQTCSPAPRAASTAPSWSRAARATTAS